MEKNRGTVVAVVAALIVSVVSLGVAFAAFSRNLTIDGNATITGSTWDIHFSSTSGGSAASSTTITNSASVVPSSETGTLDAYAFNWTATFLTANESVEYHFYIVNAGDYNATLTPPTIQQPTCTSNNETVTCPITYAVTKTDGTAFTSSDSLASGASVEVVVKATMASNYAGGAAITATFPTVTERLLHSTI